MSQYQACIFDLDGTILYTLDSIAYAGNHMLAELGFAPQPVEDYRYYCGDGSLNLVKRVLKKVDGYTEENLRSGDILNRKFLNEAATLGVRPYEGVAEVLAAIRSAGIKLAVFSNKPDHAAQIAVETAYPGVFDHIQGQTPGIAIKPDPAGALAAAWSLGVRPEECLYFGDTWTDMKTGKAAGMYTVGVLWGYRDREELEQNGADVIIAEPADILPLCGL